MCLAVPGRVTEIGSENGLLMGRVDFSGVARRICLAHVPQVRVGDYVIVHVGFALSIIDEAEARQVFSFLARMNELEEAGSPGDTQEIGDEVPG